MEIKTIRGYRKSREWACPPIEKSEINVITEDRNKLEEALGGLAPSIIDKFSHWYPANMHIVNAFVECADMLRVEGRREYYSARAIFEHLRWNTLFEDTNTQFKLTDNICAPLVRMVMYLRPRFQGMFRLRG